MANQVDDLTLAARIRRLEDRAAITDLVVAYGFAMDERDENAVRAQFTHDATLRSQDGVFSASGVDQIIETYRGRWDVLGPTIHVSHGNLVRFDDEDPDRATGAVASHAEVWRNEAPMVVSLRYRDEYRRGDDGVWQFQDRLMAYGYYLDVREYAMAAGDPLRMRAYGEPRPADLPEILAGHEKRGWIGEFLHRA